MPATYGSASDPNAPGEAPHPSGQMVTAAPAGDEYIERLRSMLAAATADHAEQIEERIAAHLEYQYLLANMH